MGDIEYQGRLQKLDEVLRSVPYQYQHKDRIRQDVAGLLRTTRTLFPQTGTFSGRDQQVTLFYLYGVLPITYRGATYNIPVTIYFDPPYPTRAPRCFVTPTDDMAVSPNNPNVEKGGMVYMPYLSNWNSSSSSLTQLISCLSQSFAQTPPVYAKTQASRPAGHGHQAGGSGASHATATQQQPTGLFGAIGGLFGGGGGGPSPTPAAAQQHQMPVATPVQPAAAGPQVVAQVQARPVSKKDQMVRQATASLKERWPLVVEPLVVEANEQLDKRRELRAASKKVDAQIAKLKVEEEQHQTTEQRLQAAEAELSAFVAASEGREPTPEDLVQGLDADSAQVLEKLSEEHALDEFLVALDELLSNKKVGIDTFLAQVRDVSRKRYMCQALRRKSEQALRAAAAERAAQA